MIISASRRTDIPASYAEWFVRRVRAGFCEVPNPMNPTQVSRISLRPEDVDVFVFWTRSPRALSVRLHELDCAQYRYYFLYSLLGYGPPIEENNPSLETALETFRRLSSMIGPERVIWRYDPIVFSNRTGVDFHLRNFETLSTALSGQTRRCVVSIWDDYRKLGKRLDILAVRGIQLRQPTSPELDRLMPQLAQLAAANGMEIVSCAEQLDLTRYGIGRGKCVDNDLLRRLFGLEVCATKDPSQRAVCGCVKSRDIGTYDTCLFGCSYCYATTDFDKAEANHRKHNPNLPSLLPTGRA